MNQQLPKCQISHMYKSKISTGAEKSRMGNRHMVDSFHIATHGDVGNKKKRNNRNKKTKKIKKMICYGKYISGVNDTEVKQKIDSIMERTFYYNFYDNAANTTNPKLRELKPLFADKKINMIKINESDLGIVDTYVGAIMTHDNYPVFLLIPRLEAITINNKSRADTECLMWLLGNHSNVNVRI